MEETGVIKQTRKVDKNSLQRALAAVTGIIVNVLLTFLMKTFDLPIYMDSAGTVFASMVSGLYPGIMTAVISNFLISLFKINPDAMYYTLIGIGIAMASAWFVRRKKYEKKLNYIVLILVLGLFSSILGTSIQLLLKGISGMDAVEEAVNILFNIVDKAICVILASVFYYLIPEKRRIRIWYSGWRQKPLSDEEIDEINSFRNNGRQSIKKRITVMLTVASVALAAVMGIISMNHHFDDQKEEITRNAVNAAAFAADQVYYGKIDSYLERGDLVPGYTDNQTQIGKICGTAFGVDNISVVTLRNKYVPDGNKMKEESRFCYIFDINSNGEDGRNYGTALASGEDDEILPYLKELASNNGIATKEPEKINRWKFKTLADNLQSDNMSFTCYGASSDDIVGWKLKVYYPVFNNKNEIVCFVVADASMGYIGDYLRKFMLKTFLVFSGFFLLILGFGLWVSGHFLIFPIGHMASFIDGFIKNSEDQKIIDQNVRNLRAIDINTNDELETLYNAICEMAAGTAEQMRSIRHYADSTVEMQNGLIITMADLVENRDSDTGAHIQKTAAYVKIILDGLEKKGYYLEKLTPKFKSDAIMSAPLHDVGKINISDTVLNKPGKLTDEEFEIMKTHTTHGRLIIEKAISTVHGENYLKEARNMAAYHHERWDGKGYPEGLHGQVIPLSARIMAVADVFDALTSPRVYKPAFPLEKALEIIEEGSGKQFDPKCVEAFMDSLTEVKLVMKKYQEL